MKSFLNSLLKFHPLLFSAFIFLSGFTHAQGWLTTGNSGLTNTNFLGTTDARDLILKTNNTQYGRLTSNGQWRLGATSSYMKIDSLGRMSFSGSGVYQVNSNAYAFQWIGNANIGLFFSSSNSRYEFRNSTAGQAFYCTSGGVGYFSSKLSLGTTTVPTGALLANGLIESSSGGFKFPDATTQTTAFIPYTAGTGISIAGNTVTNSKPDQTVTLTGNGATTVTGTYPNFTVSTPPVTSVWSSSGDNIYNNNGGNVGINTSTPDYRLTLKGSVNDIYSVWSEDGTQSSDNFSWQVAPGSGTATSRIGYFFGNFGNENGFTIANGRNAPIRFAVGTGQEEMMRISSSGNIGIGTNSPAEKLDVAGTTKTSGLQVTAGANAGYVLQSDADGNANWVDPSTFSTVYSAGNGIAISGTTITNTAADQEVTLTGNGATTVSGSYPDYIISSTDNNTTYDGGNGIDINGTTITNTAPDQTVTLSGTGATSVSGTYPNFTISSTDNNTSYAAGTGLSLSGTTFTNTSPTQWINSGSNISYSDGKVGIGTSSPSSELSVGTEADVESADQSQTTEGNVVTTSLGNKWQSFTAGISGSLTKVSLFFYFTSSVTNRTITIYAGQGTTGAALGSGTLTSQPDSWVNCDLSGITVTVGDTFTISIDNGSYWLGAPGNLYAGGRANGNVANDQLFKTYVTHAVSGQVYEFTASGLGIGTASPSSGLDVRGTTTTEQFTMSNNAVNGYVLQSNANGNASWVNPISLANANWTTSGSNQYSALSGNVGIGTSSPSQKLEVSGTTKTTNLQLTGGATNGYVLQTDAGGNASWVNPTSLSVTETDPQVGSSTTNKIPKWNGSTLTDGIVYDDGTNVGIGTTSPSQKLEVSGTTKTTNLQLTSGASNGYVLKSDASGNGTWNSASSLGAVRYVGDSYVGISSGPGSNGSSEGTSSFLKNIFLGNFSGSDNTSGNLNVYMGYDVMSNNTTGSGNVAIGTQAGHNNITGSGNVFIGSNAGYNETGSDKLYIADGTGSPLIYGDFITRKLTVNNNLDVNGTVKATVLQMTNGATSGYVLRSDASGTASWVNPTSLSITETDPQVSSSTTNKVPRWSGSTLSDGLIYDNGSLVGIGTSAPSALLHVYTSSGSNSIISEAASGNGYFDVRSNSSNEAAIIFRTVNKTRWEAGKSTGTESGSNAGSDYFINRYDDNGNYLSTPFGISRSTGNVGIGTTTPVNVLDVKGGMAIGSTYSGTSSAPSNGAIIEGNVGIGTASVLNKLDVEGGIAIGASYSGTSGAPSNGAIIQGDLGIGTSTVNYKLDLQDDQVAATNSSYVAQIYNTSDDNTGACAGLQLKAGHTTYNSAKQSNFVAFKLPGGTQVGAIVQTSASGISYSTTSDLRLKENVRNTKYGLKDLMKIQVSDYNYKTDRNNDQTGYIAQQLYSVFPDAVHAGGDDVESDPWMVDYGRVTPLLVKSIQELSNELDEKEAVIAKQQQQLDEQQQQITSILQQLNELKTAQEACCFTAQTSQSNVTSQSVSFDEGDAPSLQQNSPNPFFQNTVIRYYLPENSVSAQIIIATLTGNILKTVNLSQPGAGEISINAGTLAAGSYRYSLVIDDKVIDTKQMILTK